MTFGLLDLTPDQRPDLVVYRDECDVAIGAVRWDVYDGGAPGFAAAPRPFSLPAARCGTAFDAAARSGAVTYGLIDLSCDELPELVVHGDDCDAAIGDSRWDLYPADTNGFAPAPVSLAIPAARCATRFDKSAAAGSLGFSLLDLYGHRRSDLVVYSDDCDGAVGSDRWDVYPIR